MKLEVRISLIKLKLMKIDCLSNTHLINNELMRQVLLNTNSAVPIILQKIKTVNNVFVKVITKSKDPGQIQLLNNHQQSFSNLA